MMQQRISNETVLDIVHANKAAKWLTSIGPRIEFQNPNEVEGKTKSFSIMTYVNATFSVSASSSHGQTGIVSGIVFPGRDENHEVYRLMKWVSLKQRQVCYSVNGNKLLVSADADNRSYITKTSLQSIFPKTNILHSVVVESERLYNTLTTLHKGKDYGLKQTLKNTRDSFESVELGKWK